MGRLTKDPEFNSEKTYTRFNLAVDRNYKKEGAQNTDFLNCIAFGKTAEFINKYFSKGQRILLDGTIRTGSYTKPDGTKVYNTDIVAEQVEFVEPKKDSPSTTTNRQTPPPPPAPAQDEFINADELDDTGLPWA